MALLLGGGVLVSLGVAVGTVRNGGFRQTCTPHPLLGRVTATVRLLDYGIIPLAALLAGKGGGGRRAGRSGRRPARGP
ncbi:hypothetical protein AWW66_15290 [Micromonospora rosaria]|uniref:Uncharacterized protein n=1 Tax=Micromonospora rosaria TaxID=47874 RepID=A0A136PRQ5_9ACTN|nr:hypothetical protein [Micromonospora rosaria]KXK61140.1 hypothetical protein AWW66_15290 [Micromonospora rosaria]